MTVQAIKECRPSNIQEAFSKLEELAFSKQEIIFRGHSSSKFRLTSTFSRYLAKNNWRGWSGKIVDDLVADFIARSRSNEPTAWLPADIKNRRAAMEFARHYGVPSPLIDFTFSPYVAIFFAYDGVQFGSVCNKDDDCVVIYALNTHVLGASWVHRKFSNTECKKNEKYEEYRKFIGAEYDIFDESCPSGILKLIYSPASWNKRMQSQMGSFLYDSIDHNQYNSCEPKERRVLEDFIKEMEINSWEWECRDQPIITKLFMKISWSEEVFWRLELMGVTGAHLLGWDGAARDIWNRPNRQTGRNLRARITGHAWDLDFLHDKSGS
ncbi:MAG: FRG domain-containing protein [Acidibrevibacterium sp.]|jgi:hypothetical protein|uniref:FRG domain-containing protein n=1 Tax=Acidibrevibacterium fodinaquatile TaxID=1969806 RepID=UPI0023A7C36D|nr:FRG domain-containing protein [Acidibrevibacterium fodinaquatile]MCA7118713.1 FRG domain-containing protein [Acidibrevibacterium fodinaquatile]